MSPDHICVILCVLYVILYVLTYNSQQLLKIFISDLFHHLSVFQVSFANGFYKVLFNFCYSLLFVLLMFLQQLACCIKISGEIHEPCTVLSFV